MQTHSSDKLKSKDLITIAVFSVLIAVIQFVVAMLLGIAAFTYPFVISVTLVPVGILWVYLRVKVPKRWALTVQSAIFALLMFLVGSGWWLAIGFLLGGLAAELFSGVGRHRDFTWNTIGYAAFGVVVNLCGFSPILLAAKDYYDFCIKSGLDTGYLDTLMAFVSWPLLALTSVLAAAGAVLGMLLGRAMMKKHFLKAGIA